MRLKKTKLRKKEREREIAYFNENIQYRAVDESEKLRRSRTQNGDPWSSAPDDDDDDDDGDGDDDDDDDGEENDDHHQQRKSSTLPNQNDKTKASVNDLRNRTKHCDQIVLKVVGGRQKFKQKSTRTVSNQKRKSIQSSSSTSSTTTTTTSKKNSIKKQTKSKCLSLNRKQQTNLSTRKSNLKRSITAATTANKNRLKRKSQTVKSIGVGGRLGQKGVIASTARSRKSQTSKSSPTKLVQRLNSRTKKSQKKSNKASQKDQSEDDESDDDDDDDNSDETEDDPDDDDDNDDDNDEEGEEDEDEEDSDEYEEENNGETIEDNRTIADLIKCSNRREAVRKAAARAALASVNNSRNKKF
ncbi:hypothetical protein QR98_0012470 [Sarcoptes scabiei]|uniref:Uncharacterized protein n=1 Tax=Sarcoptes scabiei TaxID=52283 RepID=A0A131ZVM9_SARSC|nr:hypothetical protein QR98_0012470 [Sarcoptes scabiei]